MAGLTTYTASAGTGKTYILVRDYISMLFNNPELFKHILAVTFTNKAAGEMKSRILQSLYKLSKDPENAEYFEFLSEKYIKTPEAVARRSGNILAMILYEYSRFSVQTIDSFFQRILRSFVYELGLQHNYRIQLDTKKALRSSVDMLIHQADTDKKLREWLIAFSESKLDEGKSWDLNRDINELGKELFNEQSKILDKELSELLADIDTRKEFLTKITGFKKAFEDYLSMIGKEGIQALDQNGLSVLDFAYKERGPANYFFRLASKSDFDPKQYVRNVITEPEKWVTGTHPKKTELLSFAKQYLQDRLSKAVEYYDTHIEYYNTISLILRNFYSLGIFNLLKTNIQNYLQEENEFLISEMAGFINRLISQNDSPFLYEKSGVLFHHYFLDEFQDTSLLQWRNFKPLISNSLAGGYDNLIVGDVKQAIYRWRNSDWTILGFQLGDAFNQQKQIQLDSNYRSSEHIVRFNNTLFSVVPKILQDHINEELHSAENGSDQYEKLQEEILRVYKDVVQIPTQYERNVSGQVNISFLDSSEDKTWQEAAEQQMTREVHLLIKAGVDPAHIAILVRNHREGQRIVEALMKHRSLNDPDLNYSIVSSDALYLKNSASVRILIGILKYLIDPDETLNQVELFTELNHFRNTWKEEELTERLRSIDTELFSKDEILALNFIKRHSLTDLVEGSIRLFDLGMVQEEVPYLNAFSDLVIDYLKDQPGDLHSFLEWWDEEGQNSSLPGDEGNQALRIITIHKSKGLEFRYVFIPYASWSLDHEGNKGPVLWCENMDPKLAEFHVVPIKYSSKMLKSYYKWDYLNEKVNTYVDQLNLLYVAFTRAKEGLYVCAPAKEGSRKTVAGLIKKCFETSPVSSHNHHKLDFSDYWDSERNSFKVGLDPIALGTDPSDHKTNMQNLDTYNSWPGQSRMRLKYQGVEFFSDEHINRLRSGNLLHELFEKIQSFDDVDDAIHGLEIKGKITSSEANELQLRIRAIINQEPVCNWFDGSWQVRNEPDILIPGGRIIRPDRVMFKAENTILVDYKFGKEKLEKHNDQIKRYIDALYKMGYLNIKAYLWYVELGEVKEVIPNAS